MNAETTVHSDDRKDEEKVFLFLFSLLLRVE